MSAYDYHASQKIEAEGWPFYALLMAAMRQADSSNIELLRFAFPDVYDELQERYNAPGGLIGAEVE